MNTGLGGALAAGRLGQARHGLPCPRQQGSAHRRQLLGGKIDERVHVHRDCVRKAGLRQVGETGLKGRVEDTCERNIVALVVGGIVVAMYMPVFDMASSIR